MTKSPSSGLRRQWFSGFAGNLACSGDAGRSSLAATVAMPLKDRPLKDKLERRAVEALAGRRAEIERLEIFALGDEPLVMHIQGIPGVGKTHLLNALAANIGEK